MTLNEAIGQLIGVTVIGLFCVHVYDAWRKR